MQQNLPLLINASFLEDLPSLAPALIDDPAALDLFYKLDDTISKKRYRKMQQTEISDFFQPIGGTSFTH